MTDGDFTPTHLVPDGGIDSWPTPNATAPPQWRFEAGTPVEIVVATAGWARIRGGDGGVAWVAAAPLVPINPAVDGGAGFPPHPAAAPPYDSRSGPGYGAPTRGRHSYAPTSSTSPSVFPLAVAVPIVGACLVVLGSFLKWFAAPLITISAWDLPFFYLLVHNTTTDFHVYTGPLLLVTLFALLPLVTRRSLPGPATAMLGAFAVLCTVLALALPGPKPDPGYGLFITMAGGIVMIVSPLVAPFSAQRR